MSRLMAGRLLDEFARQSRQPAAAAALAAELTVREKEVLELVARGKSNKEIAAALAIAENTVKNHLKNILEKLHLENRVQAATFAIREGLAQKPPEGASLSLASPERAMPAWPYGSRELARDGDALYALGALGLPQVFAHAPDPSPACATITPSSGREWRASSRPRATSRWWERRPTACRPSRRPAS